MKNKERILSQNMVLNRVFYLLPSIVLIVILLKKFEKNHLYKISFAISLLPSINILLAIIVALKNYELEVYTEFYINVSLGIYNLIINFVYSYIYEFLVSNKKSQVLESNYTTFLGSCNICHDDNVECYKYNNNRYESSCKFCWFNTCNECFYKTYFDLGYCPQCKKVNYCISDFDVDKIRPIGNCVVFEILFQKHIYRKNTIVPIVINNDIDESEKIERIDETETLIPQESICNFG